MTFIEWISRYESCPGDISGWSTGLNACVKQGCLHADATPDEIIPHIMLHGVGEESPDDAKSLVCKFISYGEVWGAEMWLKEFG